MFNVFNTPYPKSTLIKNVKFISILSLAIAFILIVFQPFGTATFTHPHKYLILSGYGIIVFISGTLLFTVFDKLIGNTIKDKWTIGYEMAVLFTTIFVCQSACFFYWTWLFSSGISIQLYFNFLLIATSVSVLPFGYYLLTIYQKYRDVRHALSSPSKHLNSNEVNAVSSEEFLDATIKIVGTGKHENYEFQSEDLRLIVAEDNYVIVYTVENQNVKKWMIRATMNDVESLLNTNFLRVHRSYIINIRYLENITGNVTNTKLKLQSIDEEIPVSRARVAEVRQL
jgi:hypothetical protein